jgi:serine/threonine protein kinase
MPVKPTTPPTSEESASDVESVDSLIRAVAAISEPAISEWGPRMQLEAGELVGGRFRIERSAGRGGMGAVYRTLDLTTGLPAAVKVVQRLGRSFGERLAREARVLAELSHSAIVRYISHGETSSGMPYLAMDWLDGEDLSERLARHALQTDESLSLVRRICEGLAVAHARGVVHRDIKPSNLFLPGCDPRSVKIIDFGVARLELGSTALTRPGTSLGTAGYMSPEQAVEAADVDARADVFALGCVLFECLTGRAAFQGRPPVVLAKVLREQPPRPSEIRPDLGERFDALVGRMLAKDRTARPNDAAGLLRALEGLG